MWLATLVLLVATASPVFSRCDPTVEPDRSDIANARAAIAASCDCAGVRSHGAYVSCAAQQISLALVNRSCRGHMRRCAAVSTCGKPGFVTCCRAKGGTTKCGTARSAASCQARGGIPGECTSCCDACPAPGDGPSCTVTSTTTTPTAGDQCCLRTVICGAFDTCQVMTGAECAAAGGFDVGPGDCGGPSPCSRASTTTPPSACCVTGQCVFEGLCECLEIDHGQFLLFRICTPDACMTLAP